ncbi:hypothetical protein RH915_05000 [Serpentinicella sp. ANB-PHB4]|nr:hypothetical protein [Serpentinicella sp. ANB-PHB4]MDR5658840.1 hypothetical protein [Serpentinicella sp. ANB-PHB4]
MYYIDCDYEKACKMYNTSKCNDCIRNKHTTSDDYFAPHQGEKFIPFK